MSENAPILRSRSTTPVPARQDGPGLDLALRRAQTIAQAGEIVPPAFRNKPGAVMLVDGWAQQRDLDLLTALQGVNIIQGKVVVDATLMRALAKRAGFEVRPVEISSESVTVAVIGPEGSEVGRVTYTMDDARRAKLAEKDNWKKDPQSMLVARASTRAIRWFASDAMTGVFAEDEDIESDPAEVLRPQLVPEAPASDGIVDAEVVPLPVPAPDDQPEPDPEPGAAPAPAAEPAGEPTEAEEPAAADDPPVTAATWRRLSEARRTLGAAGKDDELIGLASASEVPLTKGSMSESDAVWLLEKAAEILGTGGES